MAKDDDSDDTPRPPPATPLTPELVDVGLSLPAPDAVTALRIIGTSVEIPLSPDRKGFGVGREMIPDLVQIALPSDFIGRHHATLRRKGGSLSVVDHESTNGTYKNDVRRSSCTVDPGETIRFADVRLLALDEHLRQLRNEVLPWCLGLDAHEFLDATIETIAEGKPILLIGPPYCEQRVLAEAIHHASPRRQRAFVAVDTALKSDGERTAVLRHASEGSMFVDLHAIPPPTEFFVKHLFGTTYKVRPLISAPSYEKARVLLGDERVQQLRIIAVPSLAARRAEVPTLMDHWFAKQGSKCTVKRMRSDHIEALRNYEWPRNFEDLRRQGHRILAIFAHGNLTRAAEALGVTPQAVSQGLARLGIYDLRFSDENDDRRLAHEGGNGVDGRPEF